MIGHRVVLRPRSFFETGDLALVFMRQHWRQFAWLLAWVLPLAPAAYAVHAFAGVDIQLAFLLEVLACSVFTGAYTLLCGELMLDSKSSLKAINQRFPRMLPGYVLTRVAGWLFLLMTIGFGYRMTAFLPESTLLERGSIRTAFSRSSALMRATPGRALGLGLITFCLLYVSALGMELGRLSLRDLFSLPGPTPDLEHMLSTWASFLGIALIQPYLAVLRFLLYIDCRTRREGWDLQVQFTALLTASQSPFRSTGAPSEAA